MGGERLSIYQRWFKHNIFGKRIAGITGIADFKVEIGVFREVACWVMANILTHQTAKILYDCIFNNI